MSITQILEEEIALSKNTRAINLQLTCMSDGVYFAPLPFKIADGDYFLTARDEGTKQVSISSVQGGVEVELDSKQQSLSAFVSKDESSILRGVKSVLKRDHLIHTPSFIVGPPGTGKTSVIVSALEKLLQNNLRVLVLSPTNRAVENVLEKISLDSFQEGEVVAAFASEAQALQQLSPKNVIAKKIAPLEELLAIASEIKSELLSKKRDLQPILFSFEQQQEAQQIALNNTKKDSENLRAELKELQSQLKTIERKLFVIGEDSVLNGLSKVLISKKLSALEIEQTQKQSEIKTKEAEILLKNESLSLIENGKASSIEAHKEVKESFSKVLDDLKEVDLKIESLSKEMNSLKMGNVFNEARLVGATLASAALNSKIQTGMFDVVIVDEASMAIMPLLIAAEQTLNETVVDLTIDNMPDLNQAQNEAVKLMLRSKMICVGDPAQLQPIAKTHELKKSVFAYYNVERLFGGVIVENAVLLDTNYRNHPQITATASEMFYGGMLKSGKEKEEGKSLYIRQSSSKMVTSEGSFINYGNMKIVIEQTRRALERGRRDIGIITPYKKQATLISEALLSLQTEYPDAHLQAGTIHTFQGKEAEIIIFDIAFSPKDDDEYVPATYNGGSDSEVAKLLNVAMTRAKDFFIVIGDVDGILKMPKDLILKNWLQKISEVK